MGVSWEQFWRMNPRILKAMSTAYADKLKIDNERSNSMAHLQGRYFADAIASTVCNMFSKGKPYEYPKEPYQIGEKRELTEKEKMKEVDLFFAREEARRKNWQRTHKKRGDIDGN